MYMQYYGLTERPFSTVPDTTFLFKSRQYLDAYNHLLYGIKAKQGFMALIGDVGTGKTTLCRALIHALEDKMETALIFNPPETAAELLKTILQDLGEATFGSSKAELLDTLNAYLLRCSAGGKGVVIIIDEAQNLGEEVLEELRLLSNLETEKEKLIQIILSGQTELLKKLSRPSLRQLYQRIAIWAPLNPLSRSDIGHYINHRLVVAGANGSILFSNPALQKIYRYSGGIPRKINLICDKSLLAGYADQKKKISSRVVREAITNSGGGVLAPYTLWVKPSYATLVMVIIAGLFVGGMVPGRWNPWVWDEWREGVHYARARMPDALLQIPKPGTPPAVQEHTSQSQVSATPQVVHEESIQPVPAVQTASHSGEFDANGVMRQEKNGECAVEALATLLVLWDIPRESIIREMEKQRTTGSFSFSDVTKVFNLLVNPMDITLEQIKLLDYPCIVPVRDAQFRYVVVSGIRPNQIILLDPLKGKTAISAEQFHAMWSGKAFYVWKDIDRLPPHLKMGDVHRQVVTLKKKLVSKKITEKSPQPDRFDKQLESAVKSLQEQFGLQVDGILGSHTKMALYRLVYGSRLPSLQS